MKTKLLLLSLVAVCCIGLLSGCDRAPEVSKSPLEGIYLLMGNRAVPFEAVGHHALTNWICVTSGISPQIITCRLKPGPATTAAPGQIWFSAAAIYENIPKVTKWCGETNGTWHSEDSWHTNDWPEVYLSAELIYVRSIEKAVRGRFKGEDIYAHCRVRQWGAATSFSETESTLLISELTNKAMLVESR